MAVLQGQFRKPRSVWNYIDCTAGGLAPYCCQICKAKDGWYDKFFAGVMATGMDAYEEVGLHRHANGHVSHLDAYEEVVLHRHANRACQSLGQKVYKYWAWTPGRN
jgi:hypothetical protein